MTSALWLGALACSLALGSCYSPALTDGFECAVDAPRCPDGFQCASDNRCYRNGGSTVDGAVPSDDAGDGGGTPRSAPINLGDGRRVAIARTTSGARIAYEDATGAGALALTAIRVVDIDDKGKVGTEQSIAPNQDRQRFALMGAGEANAYFAYTELEGTTPLLMAFTNATGPLEITRVTLGSRRVFDLTATRQDGFIVYSEGGSATAMQALLMRPIRSPLSTATVVANIPTGFHVEEIDAVGSDDSNSVLVLWREVPNTGVSGSESIRVTRIQASTGAPVWTPPVITVHTAAGPLANIEMAVSRQSGTISIVYERGADFDIRAVAYGTGAVGNPTMMLSATQPMSLVFPIAGTVGAQATVHIAAVRRGIRGPMLRRQMLPLGPMLADLGASMAAPLAVGDTLGNGYFMGQEGADGGGDLLVWSTNAAWPLGGVVLNRNARQVRGEIAAAAMGRAEGGLYVAWIENGADEGQVWVHTMNPDSSTVIAP